MWPAVLDRKQAAAYCGVSLATWEKLVRLKDAPPPRQLSPGRVGWRRTDCDAWISMLPVSAIPPGPGPGQRPC